MLEGESGFGGEFGDIAGEVEKFLQAREEEHGGQERKPEKGKKEESESKVATILEDLRGRDHKNPVTILDAIDLVSAEIEDNTAEVERAFNDERIPTEELNAIRATLENIQFMDSFTYEELARTINYLRAKRDFMDNMFENSFGTFAEAGQNSKIYTAILNSIYETMPFAFTAEAVLPEIPTYLPTPPEKYLDKLPSKENLKAKDKLEPKDAQEFYRSLKEDVSTAFRQATKDNPQWVQQKKVMLAIDAYRQEHRGEFNGPLLVTVKDGDTEIKPYRPEEESPLQRDLEARAAEAGGHTFIFDPNSKEDIKYMTDIFALNRWAIYATQAAQGIDILAGEPPEKHGSAAALAEKKPEKAGKKKDTKDKKEKKEEKAKHEITSPQFDGMRFLYNLFDKAYKDGHIKKRYKKPIEGLGVLVLSDIRSLAEVKRIPSPDPLSIDDALMDEAA